MCFVNKNIKDRRRGAVTLEAAIMLPIFLLMLVGILEFGRAVMMHQIITNACREACRKAIIHGAQDGIVTQTVHDYLDSAAISSNGRVVEIRDSAGNATPLNQIQSHEDVTIFVQIPYDENTWGLTTWLVGKQIQSEVSMRRE